MGLKDFFRKVGRGIKRAAGKVWGGIKKGAQFVGKVAKPVLSIMSNLPGPIGLIGKIGGGVYDVAKDVVNRIPNQQAKDKLNGVIDRGKEIADDVRDKAMGVADKVKPWADAGLGLMNNPPKLNIPKM